MADREHEIQVGLQQLLQDAIGASLTIIKDQFDAGFQQRISKLEEEKTYQLNLAGQNATARANIEREYNAKIAKEKEKQARADKAFAIFNVAVNTAQAIVKTFATWGWPAGIPFAALAFAAGAIQTAAIAAKPIPKYEKGTRSAKKGPAIINEKGWELIERNGRMFMEQGHGPTLVNMEGGERVHTHEASKRILQQSLKQAESKTIQDGSSAIGMLAREISRNKDERDIRILAKAMQQGGITETAMERVMNKAIGSQPHEHFHFDEHGYHRYTEEKNSRIRHLNTKFGN
jgi:hypothetical protein